VVVVPTFLMLKGILESDNGGNSWFVSRIDSLSGAFTMYSFS
jgi:hypothetical protein